MRWKSKVRQREEALSRYTKRMMAWHRWFAWFPVDVPGEDKWVWLEHVERRRQYVWEYRLCKLTVEEVGV